MCVIEEHCTHVPPFLSCVLHLQNAHNVLLSSSQVAQFGLVAKIADLGLSRVLQQHATHRTTRTVRHRGGPSSCACEGTNK